jgi:outer membrane immunogenic protein
MKYLSILLLALSSTAFAGGYAGVSYGTINTDITDHTAATLHAGYQFNEYIGVEARTLISASEETYSDVNLEVDSLYGIYLTAAMPLSDSASVYLVAGRTEGEVTASYGGYSASAEESSSSYGGGVKLNLRENWTVRAEFLQTFEDVDQVSLGLQFNF